MRNPSESNPLVGLMRFVFAVPAAWLLGGILGGIAFAVDLGANQVATPSLIAAAGFLTLAIAIGGVKGFASVIVMLLGCGALSVAGMGALGWPLFWRCY